MSAVERPFLEGKYEKAASAAEKMIDERCRQRDEVYYIKGLCELKLGKFREARDSFNTIISRYQRSSRVFDALTGIGDSYMLEGNRTEALKVYKDMTVKFTGDKNISIINERIAKCGTGVVQAEPVAEKVPPKPDTLTKAEPKASISVQAGVFKNRRNAEKLTAKLVQAGYDSYVETPPKPGDNLYRVKVGRLISREEAQSLSARLNRDGYKTKICDDSSCQ